MNDKLKHLIAEYIDSTIKILKKKQLNILLSISYADFIKHQSLYMLYLQRTKTIEQIVQTWIDMKLQKSEETIFGDWLEGLAIFICQKVYGGWKSGITGIDLEFDKDNIRYIVSIKSSPNWGNSRQIPKMLSDFSAAKKTLRTSNSKLNIVAVNGCCYGKDSKPDKGDYFKYCGQEFWSFISENENLYLDIIEPLGHKAAERNKEYQILYSQMISEFTVQFLNEFCKETGEVDWIKLVKFNSGRKTNHE